MKVPVAILGATGSVGQRFVSLLADHPYFEISELFASMKSAGKPYGESVNWVIDQPVPESVKTLPVKSLDDRVEADIVFSALPASIAAGLERELADRGKYVFTNASAHRMDHDVPILVPEVNPDHFEIVRGKRGFIVANPNCTTSGLVIPLKVIKDSAGIEDVLVVTMQAISGAGYPGIPSLSIFDNLIPHIENEEEKVRRESRKILGQVTSSGVEPADFRVEARCTRVPVRDGHTEVVFVKTSKPISPDRLKHELENFRGLPQKMNLPTAPARPIIVEDDRTRPQPYSDRLNGNGMSVTVGNLRADSIMGITFTLVVHNTIRGAAGGSILNAELALKSGILDL